MLAETIAYRNVYIILELEKENNELKRANEILKDALGFFAESRKK